MSARCHPCEVGLGHPWHDDGSAGPSIEDYTPGGKFAGPRHVDDAPRHNLRPPLTRLTYEGGLGHQLGDLPVLPMRGGGHLGDRSPVLPMRGGLGHPPVIGRAGPGVIGCSPPWPTTDRRSQRPTPQQAPPGAGVTQWPAKTT